MASGLPQRREGRGTGGRAEASGPRTSRIKECPKVDYVYEYYNHRLVL